MMKGRKESKAGDRRVAKADEPVEQVYYYNDFCTPQMGKQKTNQ